MFHLVGTGLAPVPFAIMGDNRKGCPYTIGIATRDNRNQDNRNQDNRNQDNRNQDNRNQDNRKGCPYDNLPSNADRSTACRNHAARFSPVLTADSTARADSSRRSTSATMRRCSSSGGRGISWFRKTSPVMALKVVPVALLSHSFSM